MLYRKTPAQPGRLLLRVVAGVGATAVAGAIACSSGSNGIVCDGFCVHADGGHDGPGGDTGGSSGGGSGSSSGMIGLGITDGGGDELVTGVLPNPDGGTDASADAPPDVVTGVVVHPEGGD